MRQWITLTLMLALLNACGGSASNNDNNLQPAGNPSSGSNWYRPAPGVSWQWQLQGTINTHYAVDIYDIDLFDTPVSTIQQLQANRHKVICYFSAGSWEDFRPDAASFDSAAIGNKLDGWPGEKWLDVRSSNVRQIMQTRMDLAVSKGCDGVEPDNMDGYANTSGFAFTADDQLDYNRFIANEAHNRNLSVALKNDLEQIPQLVEYYDFAVNEECFEFSECDSLSPFIDAAKAVLNVEYSSNFKADPSALCRDSLSRQFSTLILDINLDDSYRHSCLGS